MYAVGHSAEVGGIGDSIRTGNVVHRRLVMSFAKLFCGLLGVHVGEPDATDLQGRRFNAVSVMLRRRVGWECGQGREVLRCRR